MCSVKSLALHPTGYEKAVAWLAIHNLPHLLPYHELPHPRAFVILTGQFILGFYPAELLIISRLSDCWHSSVQKDLPRISTWFPAFQCEWSSLLHILHWHLLERQASRIRRNLFVARSTSSVNTILQRRRGIFLQELRLPTSISSFFLLPSEVYLYKMAVSSLGSPTGHTDYRNHFGGSSCGYRLPLNKAEVEICRLPRVMQLTCICTRHHMYSMSLLLWALIPFGLLPSVCSIIIPRLLTVRDSLEQPLLPSIVTTPRLYQSDPSVLLEVSLYSSSGHEAVKESRSRIFLRKLRVRGCIGVLALWACRPFSTRYDCSSYANISNNKRELPGFQGIRRTQPCAADLASDL